MFSSESYSNRSEYWKEQEKRIISLQKELEEIPAWTQEAAKEFVDGDYANLIARNLYRINSEPKDFGWWYNYLITQVSLKSIKNIEIVQKLLTLIYGSPKELKLHQQIQKIKESKKDILDSFIKLEELKKIRKEQLNKELKNDTSKIDQEYERKKKEIELKIPYLLPPKSDKVKKKLLEIIRVIGFVPIIPKNVQELTENNPEDTKDWKTIKNVFPEYINFTSANKQKKITNIPSKIAIVYRGDSRDFKTIIGHKGTIAKVEVNLDNTNANWNPFKDDPWMYVRELAGDNCLFSVISIAPRQDLALGFPLLDDSSIYPVKINVGMTIEKNLKQWTDTDYKKAQESKFKIFVADVKLRHKVKNNFEKKKLFVTENYLYISRLFGEYINTQEISEELFGNPSGHCKERGVRSVPLEHILAGIKLRRFHLGPIRTDGILAQVLEVKYAYKDHKSNFFHEKPNLKLIASQHFFGDEQLANQFISKIQNDYKVGSYLEGECENQNNQLFMKATIKYEIKSFKLINNFSSILSLPMQAFSQSDLMLDSSHEAILLNGEKVIFDKAVTTTPVTIEPKTTPRQLYINKKSY
ncbi:MAG: hypothetical protein F6J96_29400 [Symploca sp. SIO1C2]|nr:hypothetical protein [Symploca sp. SIO1C2]